VSELPKRGYLGPRPVEGFDPAIDRMSDEIDRLLERISTLEALTDQLAEALRCFTSPIRPANGGLLVRDALRAYEADKEAHR
jgi:hypothetical protein